MIIPDNERDGTLRRLASYASLLLAIVMVILKAAAWLMTGSVALLTSVVDSAVDLVASIVTLIGVRYAQQPPDREHRFGHGKAESLSALLQSVFQWSVERRRGCNLPHNLKVPGSNPGPATNSKDVRPGDMGNRTYLRHR